MKDTSRIVLILIRGTTNPMEFRQLGNYLIIPIAAANHQSDNHFKILKKYQNSTNPNKRKNTSIFLITKIVKK